MNWNVSFFNKGIYMTMPTSVLITARETEMGFLSDVRMLYFVYSTLDSASSA